MNFKLITAFLLLSVISFAQNGRIEVKISNVKNANGIIGVALYNNAANFTKKELKSVKVKSKKGEVTAYFENLPVGSYAIAVLHDENANDKMDFNMMGIPKEAYGFSNNAKGLFAPPKFEDAAFNIKGNQTKLLKIRL